MKVLILSASVAFLLFLVFKENGKAKYLNTSIYLKIIFLCVFTSIVIQLALDIKKLFGLTKKRQQRRRAIRRNQLLNKGKKIKCSKIQCAPYYSIENVHFKKYKGIKEINLDFTPGASWLFLTGENGYGKTVFLQALAISLYGRDKVPYRHIENNNKFSFLTTIVSPKSNKTYNSHSSKDNFVFLTCYGINRVSVYSEDSSKTAESPLTVLFEPRTLLKNIETRLINWQATTDRISAKRSEAVKKCLLKLLNLSRIKIEKDEFDNRVFYYEKDIEGHELSRVRYEELAAGCRAIIGMVGDILIKFYDTSNDEKITDPKDFKGIVIIDEFELHFHPKWQKKLPGLLSSIFPQLQFVVSTHSPVPLLGAPDNSIFMKVCRSVEDGIEVIRLRKLEKEIKYLLPNTILTSDIFDMDEIEAITNDDFDKIHVENEYKQIEQNKKIDEKLSSYLKDKDIFPDNLFSD